MRRLRTAGVKGVAKADIARSTRCAPRDVAMRTVVSMLYNVNDFLATGVYNHQRVCDDVMLDPSFNHGNGINVQAWHAAMKSATGYFSLGIFHLVQNVGFLVFPIRPRTRMDCANCNEKFSPLTISTHLRVVNCGGCGGHYCTRCRNELLAAIKKKTNRVVVTVDDIENSRDIWHCHQCKQGSSKKKGK